MGDPVLDAIERLATLPAGWDSYGAPGVAPGALKRAKDCLEAVQWRVAPHYVPPTVGPDVGGGVELIWETARGDVHALIGTGERLKVLVMRDERLVAPAQTKTVDELITLLKTHL